MGVGVSSGALGRKWVVRGKVRRSIAKLRLRGALATAWHRAGAAITCSQHRGGWGRVKQAKFQGWGRMQRHIQAPTATCLQHRGALKLRLRVSGLERGGLLERCEGLVVLVARLFAHK